MADLKQKIKGYIAYALGVHHGLPGLDHHHLDRCAEDIMLAIKTEGAKQDHEQTMGKATR